MRGIRDLPPTDQLKQAERIVTRIVRDTLVEIIVQRQDAVEDYETALLFIGEAGSIGVQSATDSGKKAPPATSEGLDQLTSGQSE